MHPSKPVVVVVVAATILGLCAMLLAAPSHRAAVAVLGVLLVATELLWGTGTPARTGGNEAFPGWHHALRLTRWSLYGIGLVVLLFGATIVFTQAVLEPIQERTEALTRNALPSVRYLAHARSAIVRLQTAMRTYMLAEPGTEARAARLTDVRDARHDVDVAFAEYAKFPQFPHEYERVMKVDGALALLDEHMAPLLARPAVPSSEIRAAEIESILPFVEEADQSITDLQIFNVDQAANAANAISASNAVSRATALTLSGLSIVIAFVAGALVHRVGRKQARMAAEHEEVLMMRATELEAFAGRVAHDLKNPLGTLALRVAVLQRNVGGEEER
ncbi:MAG TPA: hypothetical protein VLM85_18160, partial [Polyangiaceae bacterium]|nr:hypothetical protein [Polyangiaceae bacterium]